MLSNELLDYLWRSFICEALIPAAEMKILVSPRKKLKKKWNIRKMGKHYNLIVKYTNPLDLVTISMLVIFVSTPETHKSLFYTIIFIYILEYFKI